VDIFVGNSGGPRPGPFTSLSWSDWMEAHQLLLGAHVMLLKLLYPALRTRQGNVVFIGSTAIRQPLPGLILSNVYRTALASLAKTLSKEWGPQGIRVNLIYPGAILTERLRKVHQGRAELFGSTEEAVREEERGRIALRRFGEAREVAEAVLFLVSERAGFITGTSLTVDGGLNDVL
jgi:3-oxoacyl-[acyl-carrier protein] reductase